MLFSNTLWGSARATVRFCYWIQTWNEQFNVALSLVWLSAIMQAFWESSWSITILRVLIVYQKKKIKIGIKFGTCEIRRLNWALVPVYTCSQEDTRKLYFHWPLKTHLLFVCRTRNSVWVMHLLFRQLLKELVWTLYKSFVALCSHVTVPIFKCRRNLS